MPWPISTSHNATCCYVMCEQSGHAVCVMFADYYERLCAAVQKAVDDPTLANLAALKAVHDEETRYVH